MSAAVEVFEVGVEQISDFVRDGRLRDFTRDAMYVPCDGDYVVVECSGCLGYVSRPRFFVSYGSLDRALSAVAAYLASDARTTYAHDYEIWHVCDDDDLWQAWEHDAWIARMLDGGMYDKVYVLPSGTEDDACGFEGEHTDWHVYDGRDCVMDLERVPQVLYKLETLDECMSVLETKWYTDEMLFAGDMGFALAQGCKLWLGDVSPMPDAVTIVDDYDCMLDDYGDGSVLEVTLLAATA